MFIENELINQKNHICDLINDEKYEEAWKLIEFIAPLWKAAEYEYKTKELRTRIKDAYRHNMIYATHHKTRAKWEKLYYER